MSPVSKINLHTVLRMLSASFYQFFDRSPYTSILLKYFRSSCCGSVETNPTSIHEVMGMIPGPAQWVKEPALPVAAAQASSYSSYWTPSLGTSICCRFSPQKQ